MDAGIETDGLTTDAVADLAADMALTLEGEGLPLCAKNVRILVERLRAEAALLAEAEKALEPFALASQALDTAPWLVCRAGERPMAVTREDFRLARTALSHLKQARETNGGNVE